MFFKLKVKKLNFVFLVLVFILIGCSFEYKIKKCKVNEHWIRKGMTIEKVYKKIGKPLQYTFKIENKDTIKYLLYDYYDRRTIILKNNIVIQFHWVVIEWR